MAFSVTWRIENFTMCPHKNGEYFKSPSFTLPGPPELRKTKWNFWLYPRGRGVLNSNQVSFYIERKDPDPDQGSKVDTFFIALSVVSYCTNPNHFTYEHVLELACNMKTGYPQFISRALVRDPDEEYLTNDTLTIHLFIYPAHSDGLLDVVPGIKNIFPINPSNSNYTIEKVFSKDSDAKDMPLNHVSFLTRIPVERKRLNWTIKDLSAKRKSKERTSVVTLDSEFREGVKMTLVVYFEGFRKGNESLRIGISRKGMDLGITFIKCDAHVMDSSNVIRGSENFEFFFDKTYRRWSFPLINKLGSSECLTNDDSLELILDFTVSYDHQNVDYLTGTSKQNDLQKEIWKMLEYEETFDASFECKIGKKFPVHKFLLCAKSPVFRAMFSSDTLEKQTGLVRMLDTDTTTVQHLRDYFYSNSLPDLGTEDTLKLYSVAHKYQMDKLRNDCASFLKCNMTEDNVFEILIKADMHQDSGLKHYAHEFLIGEMDFDSDVWKMFMEKNLMLAAETEDLLRETREAAMYEA